MRAKRWTTAAAAAIPLALVLAGLASPGLASPGLASPGLAAAPTLSAAPRAVPTSALLPGTHCQVFPADNYWHADISKLRVNPRSAQWLSHMQVSTRRLHADFGPAYGEQPVPYGIPITIVNGSARFPVRFEYASESYRGPYPLNGHTKIEGGWYAGGDRHAIVVDAKTCILYETWNTRYTARGWTAGSGAAWSLRSDSLRPAGWTSADAAGLPILPGLLRYDEVHAGRVDHAIRFTTNITDRRYVWPARHQAGSVTSLAYPPMGARFRLKSTFSARGFSRDAQVVIAAMKKYGLVLADNGSPWYFQGTSDARWTGGLVQQLGKIPASAFQAVDTAPLRISNSSAKSR